MSAGRGGQCVAQRICREQMRVMRIEDRRVAVGNGHADDAGDAQAEFADYLEGNQRNGAIVIEDGHYGDMGSEEKPASI